jgi:hypothetical protein
MLSEWRHEHRPRAAVTVMTGQRGGRSRLLLLLLLSAAGCRDVDVVTQSYATLAEATADGAVARGYLPQGLPAGTHDIREAHDTESARRWGLFDFPAGGADALRMLLGPEISLQGLHVDTPQRIEWWPVLLRGSLNDEQIRATGARAYAARDGDLIFGVNWQQGRAYYWTRQR